MFDLESRTEREEQSRFICTANHGFLPYAQEELRRLFGSVKSTVVVPGEVFAVTLQVSAQEAVEQIGAYPPMFLRHLFPVQFQENNGDAEQILAQLTSFILNRSELNGSRLNVQVRKSEGCSWEGNAGSLKQEVMDRLAPAGAEFTLQDADYIVSLFAGDEAWYAGVSRPADNLSDWNGGAIRFQREEVQISRAKFKLLEAEATFGIDFRAFHKALDIGAAPGGWTSFLLERGLEVTAVDPAKMNTSLLESPRLTYLRKNAGEVKFREREFDLLVCDMSWSPKLMAKLVTDLLYSLQTGGTAIVTVKLMHKKPLALIKEVITLFEESGMQLQRVKQLFHNRDEVTLFMIKYD
ncbi:SAM-dependent methyltransferase [Paenibacillus sp. JX-17]|uniref:SAM-dependent methyltransferase n=1 Tax=Paenibacillus lacisoli TaxID=3064525 RepID=A0ABT9C6N9_9BACL|nr:SAM-dependent methyltransferase [Paenibacillus sp. JX-17]MDO7904927.1 SAM-dependent methyltransferase [Paenibacillus sp. JX-17]